MGKNWKLSNHFSVYKKLFNAEIFSYSESFIIDGKVMYKVKPHGKREKQLQKAEKINKTCWASRNVIIRRY